MVLGYVLYSKFLARRVYKLQDSFVTPAHELGDGVDYVPTNKYVLWGHHFTSVAGAAPIVGPAIAVIWGWVPAFLWVTIGTVFFAFSQWQDYKDDDEDFFDTYDSRRAETTDNRNRGIQGDGDSRVVFGRKA